MQPTTPPTLQQLVNGLGLDSKSVRKDIETLLQSYSAKSRGIEIRAVGGGYQMFTKAEHHEAVSAFVKSSRPKLKLSKPAVETLAVVAYRQPVTLPEIQAIRGVNTTGVIHTLLNHKLIATAGRKKIIGRPMQYKTTKGIPDSVWTQRPFRVAKSKGNAGIGTRCYW